MAQETPKTYREKFTEGFAKHVTAAANRDKWTPKTRSLAIAYIKALVEGDGQVPAGLRNQLVVDTIREKFARSCVFMQVPEGRFIGQSQDWFAEALAQAQKFAAARQEQRVKPKSAPSANKHHAGSRRRRPASRPTSQPASGTSTPGAGTEWLKSRAARQRAAA